MNHKRVLILSIVVLTILVSVGGVNAQGPISGARAPNAALGTAFTYQGQLKKSGSPVTSTCSFTFGLWNAASSGTQLGSNQTISGVSVSNGFFTTQVNGGGQFGANAFTGDARWLQISAQCTGDGSATSLGRQQLTPAPYALALPGLYTQQHATSPNVIGGYSDNSVTSGVYGAAIGGGGGSGWPNRVTDNYGTVGGGYRNQAGDNAGSTSDRAYTTVGGGTTNTASNYASTVGGGEGNTAGHDYATISGGESNKASHSHTTVSGGKSNTASGAGAFVGGGGYDGTTTSGNTASGKASTIGGGMGNTASGAYATVGGGSGNSASGLQKATISGGSGNTASDNYATVGGGASNSAAFYGTVGGGGANTASHTYATVGGGQSNIAGSNWATIPGGINNAAVGEFSFAAGRRAKANHDGAFVWGDSTDADIASTATNQFIIRATNGTTVTANFSGNAVYGYNSGGSGVKGETASIGAIGVYGLNTHTSSGYGVYGQGFRGVQGYTSRSGGTGGFFMDMNTTASGTSVGMWAGSYYSDIIQGHELDASGNSLDKRFRVTYQGNVYADGTYSSPAADFAEMLPAATGLEAGDVLVVGLDGKLTRSSAAFASAVVGVYSTKPGFVGGSGDGIDPTGKIPLAIIGIVPVKASAENGAIQPGDLLVASSTPGHAMKAGSHPPVGTVIGKALGSLQSGTGVIQMLVTLQ